MRSKTSNPVFVEFPSVSWYTEPIPVALASSSRLHLPSRSVSVLELAGPKTPPHCENQRCVKAVIFMHVCSLWGTLLMSSHGHVETYRFPSFFLLSFFPRGRVFGLSFTRCFCIVFSAKTGNFVISFAAWKQILRKPFGRNIYEVVNGGEVKYNWRLQFS